MRKALFAIFLALAPVAVQAALPAALDTPDNREFVGKLEAYVNSVSTLTGRFHQESSNGAKDQGVFYMKRPGRMRLEYASPMLLVADGESLVYYDKKLDQISYLPQSSQPASVILDKNFSLENPKSGIRIKDISRADGLLELSLSTDYERQAGVMTLMFRESPIALYGWRVKDAQGITTFVHLSDVEGGAELDNSLFKITRRGAFGGKKKGFY